MKKNNYFRIIPGLLLAVFFQINESAFAQSYDVIIEVTSNANSGAGTLRAALPAAQSNANAGKKVLVSFNINSTPALCQILDFLPPVSISAGSITFDRGNFNYEQGLQYIGDSTNQTVQYGLSFNVSGTASIYLRNLTLKDFNLVYYPSYGGYGTRMGIILSGLGKDIEITNCIFQNIGTAISSKTASSNIKISNNLFNHSTGSFATAFVSSLQPAHPDISNVEFDHNTISFPLHPANWSRGIQYNWSTSNPISVNIHDNSFEGNQGVALGANFDNLPVFNLLNNSFNKNIYGLRLTNPKSFWRIENNSFVDYSNRAISIEYASNVSYETNIDFIGQNVLGYSPVNSGNTFFHSNNATYYGFAVTNNNLNRGAKIIGYDLGKDIVFLNQAKGVIVRQTKAATPLINSNNSNGNIAAPVIQKASKNGDLVILQYSLSGLNPANENYVVDFYKSDTKSAVLDYLGTHEISGSASGAYAFTINTPLMDIGAKIAATVSSIGDSGKTALGTSRASYANVVQLICPAIAIGSVTADPGITGASDGAIDITPSGGTAPYTFYWDNGRDEEDPQNLSAGTYYVTVTDAWGCTGDTGITLTDPPCNITLSDSVSVYSNGFNISRHGAADGSINLSASVGIPPFSYTWNDGFTGEDRQNLSVGEYTVTVTDTPGCSTSKTIVLTEPPVEKTETGVREASIILKAGTTLIQDGNWSLDGDAIMQNEGTLVITGDWVNNSTSENALEGNGTIELAGENEQFIKGTNVTTFNNLTLSGNGTKSLEQRININGQLYINNASLLLKGQILNISSLEINAVDGNKGYVKLESSGTLMRSTNSKEDYLYPLILTEENFVNLKIKPGSEVVQQFSLSSDNADAITIKAERTNDSYIDNFLIKLQKNGGKEINLLVERDENSQITGVTIFHPLDEKYQPLNIGSYSVTNGNILTLNSLNALDGIIKTLSACSGDDNRNWMLTKTYDEQGNLSGMSKSYSDFLGRPLQVQTKNLTANQVLASQIIYDKHGRPVATSLSAPVDQTDFCFKEHFITDNITGNDYTQDYFDLPATPANASGEIYNPRTVGSANPGTLGWYYSNNNTLEPFVPTTGFPYYRVEYDDNNQGRIKQTSLAGETHRMGAGHETESYMMKASTELFYVFGFTEGWGIAADNSDLDINLGGVIENINPVLNLDYQAWKTIKIDRNGNEKVIFTDISGNVIATCSSGKLNGANVKTVNVNSPILTGSSGYVDIHLPDGCESSLYLQNGVVFNILNLRTNQFVKFSGYSESSSGTEDITGSSDDFFTLTPGVYRVIDKYKTSDNNSARNVHYQLNYYDFTLYYYDKANRLIKIVPPEGTDPAYNLDIEITNRHGCKNFYANSAFTPKWSLSSSAHQPGFYFNLPQATSSTSQFTNLYFYLDDDGTTSCTTGGEEGGDGGAQFRTAQTLAGRIIAEGSALLRQSGEGSGIGDSDALFKAPGDDVELFTESNENCDCPPPTGISHCMDPQCGGFDDAGAASQWADFYCSKQYCGDAPWGYTGYATRHWGDADGPFCIYCDQKRPGPGWIARYEIYYDVYTVTAFNTNPLPPPDVAANRSFFADRYADGTWQFSSPEDLGTAVVDYLQSFTSNQVILVVSDVKEFTVTINTTTGQGTIPQTYDYTYLSEIRLNIDARTFDVSTDEPAHLMASTFQYNTLGWLLTSERPDEGKSEFVYRNDGQLRFSQDARQANENKFSYFNYDRSARVVESGVFASSSVNNLYFQNHKLSLTLPSGANSIIPIIGNLSSNDGLADTYCSQQTFLLYDVPDANFPTTPSYLSNYKQTFLHGKISKTWNANPATSATWYSYDEQGASRWMVQDVAGLGIKTMDYAYSSKGLLDRTDFQKYVNAEKFAHRFTYDADQRLIKAETSSNDGTSWLEQAEYSYYLHGPLKRIELADDVQGIDYTYTINGWLKAINHPGSLDAGTGGKGSECNNNNLDPGQDGFSSGAHSGFSKDVFGMALDYHWLDYNRSNTCFDHGIDTDADQFNGNIKSMRWKTLRPFEQPAQEQQMYSFNYDKRNWLTEATFGSFVPCVVTSYTPDGEPAQIGPPTKTPTDDYKLWGLSYDRNGNILSMNRNALEVPPQADVPGSTLTTRNMDGMTYNYTLTGGRRVDNKLNFITDAGDNAKPNAWQDIKNQNADNYVYDNAGQMIYDASEDNFYEYDASGLVTGIYKKLAGSSPPQKDAAKPKVKFYYDEAGLRIKKEAFHKFTFALTKETWYVNNAIYEKDAGGAATPQLEELGVFGLGRIGIYNKPGNSYLYELTDHLGSVRATIGRQKNTDGAAQLMSSSDQYPWGMPMPAKTFNTYRFDYQGAFAEKDAETGFNNFELRMWDGRSGRWNTTDAYMQFHSPYLGMGNNPIRYVDPDGGFAGPGGNGFPYYTEYHFPEISVFGWISVGSSFVQALASSLQASVNVSKEVQRKLANTSSKTTTITQSGSGPPDGGYDGSYMIPSAAYDYSIEGTIEGKFEDDWNYILHGKEGNPFSRYGQLLARDWEAASSEQKTELGINIASSIFPVFRVGKISVPFKGFTAHGVNQAITRGIKSSTILDVIRKGTSAVAMGRYGTQIRYTYNGTTVVVGASGRNAGKIITVW